VLDADRRRIWTTLEAHAGTGNFTALRTLAIASLVYDCGLRLSEVLSLSIEQVTERGPSSKPPRFLSTFHLEDEQAKGREDTEDRRGYSSARVVVLPKRVRAVLGRYCRELRRRKWIKGWRGSLWVVQKGREAGTHEQVSERTLQAAWNVWQLRAGVADPYRFHDLRHTAITRWTESTDDVFAVALLSGHNDVRTTLGYKHASPKRLVGIVERASAASG
jgi:integrase